MSQTQKQPRLHDFITKTKTKVEIIPNLDHEINKIRTITLQVLTKIQKYFIAKKKQNKIIIRKHIRN
jgi:hypothetical protein